MLGFLVGLGAAMVLDRVDRRVLRAEDVTRLLDLPVLLRLRGKDLGDEATLLPARSRGGQAFHEVSHTLTATLGGGRHAMLVTSASIGGGSLAAANLAAALARTESSVVLVSADLEASAAASLLGVGSEPGLTDVLVHGMPVSTVEQRPAGLPRLRVIPPGSFNEQASELLQRDVMGELIATLRQSAEYVVIEAPPTPLGADAQALAERTDAAILVVEVPRTQQEQVRDSVRQLDRMGTAVLGAIVLPVREPERPNQPIGEQSPASTDGHTGPVAAVRDVGLHRGRPARSAGRTPLRHGTR